MSHVRSPLRLGAIIFENIDQGDFTGPFEILAGLPDSTFHVIGKALEPVRDTRGLILTPQMSMAEAPQLDVLLVPGGMGVNVLMEDDVVLDFIRRQAPGLRILFSVCTGALVLGAAGLLKGRRATTHWASHALLSEFGAIPVKNRVVVDAPLVTTAGVTSGIDGALRVASLVAGEAAAQAVQLFAEYDPQPPFRSGTPETAPPEIVRIVQSRLEPILEARRAIVRRVTSGNQN